MWGRPPLEPWQSFYQVLGSASGAIIGLLFIVATLSAGMPNSGVAQGMKLFSTPTLVHLAMVLAQSVVALIPAQEAQLARPLALAGAVGGLVYVAAISLQLKRLRQHTHWTDIWFYGAAPLAVYLGLVLAAAAKLGRVAHGEAMAGLVLVLLLLLSIRNAWDLVTWLAPRQEGREPDAAQP